jgi:thiol-disulfide isomerase/thioredoxin
MNWPRYVVEYGDIVAITLLMGSVIAALAIVLRGFQAKHLRRNFLSALGMVVCCLSVFVALKYMRIAPQKMAPLKPVFRRIGQPAPDLAYTSLTDNSTHHLSEFNGKLVVLNIWATWCAACQSEMPDLNRLQQAYGDRVVVLTITDEDAATVAVYKPLATMSMVKGRVTEPNGGLYVRPDVVRPLTHIIDSRGVLRETLIGQQSYQQFQTEVVRYLAPSS